MMKLNTTTTLKYQKIFFDENEKTILRIAKSMKAI